MCYNPARDILTCEVGKIDAKTIADTASLPPVAPCTPCLITTVADLERLAARILASPAVAVDTESDSLYSYSEKICLVQVSLPDADFIIDPLSTYSLEPLADVFASPAVEKVFHGADYDLVSLKRGYGFHFAHIFDTMVAARILGRKKVSLAALVAEFMGVQLDKSQQRSNWGRRPLSPEQLAYACHDTRYLLRLHDCLLEELRRAGREQEAREAFVELAMLEPRARIFDPDGFWRIGGVRDLNVVGQRIVRSLYRWREEQARWEDRPVFRVMSDHTLVGLGREQPASYEALRRTRLLSPYQLTRYGHVVLDIIAKARRSQEKLPGRSPTGGRRPDGATLIIYERLRQWRKERAAQRGVDPDVIASNDLLMAIASQRPRRHDDLKRIPGLGPWRCKEYGGEILAVLDSILGPETGEAL